MNGVKEKNDEISTIYKIFKELYLKAPPILKDLSSKSIDIDYKKNLDDHIDFITIEKYFQDKKYCSITDVVKDIRLVFLNCYKFYGTESDHTIKSLELEELLEKEISCLNEYYRALADIKLTFKLLDLDEKPISIVQYPKDCYDSILLKSVAHCHPERLKNENYKILCSTNGVDNAHVLEELTGWETEIYFIDHYQYISSMWELPEIGNFLAIIFKELDIDIINQGIIERMFVMPKESTTMSKIMSFLLMPTKKNIKSSDQIMPYKVWSEKLSNRLSEWYKIYHAKERNKVNVMNLLGIHPDFWAVVGDENPLIVNDYCELSYLVKVWLVKGLCDYVTNKYKTINDIILNCNERQCTIWKNDLETEEYFYFKSMPDLRIYYYFIPYDQPNLEFLQTEKIKEDTKNEELLSKSSIPNIFFSNLRVQPNGKYFKIIADSVQGLRAFLNELDIENKSVPNNLISALEKFIREIEPEECNLIVLNNNSKIKLYKEWKSYSERYENDENKAISWEKKESKSISQVVNKEIISEKRKRSIVQPKYNSNNFILYSDEYESKIDEECSETNESYNDYSDSEDEWGLINQIKTNITKQATKLEELERKLIKEKKLSNINEKVEPTELQKNLNSVKKKLVNKKCDYFSSNNMVNEKNMNDILLIDSEDEEDKEIFDSNKSNHIVENYKNDVSSDEVILLIDSKKEEDNQIIVSNKPNHIVENDQNDVSSNEVILLIDSEKEKNNQILASNKQKRKIDSSTNKEETDTKKINIGDLKDAEIITLNDDNLYSCEILSKNNEKGISTISNSVESNKNDEVISIEDDEEILISDDDDDDIQFIGCSMKTQNLDINKPSRLRNNFNRSQNCISRKKQITNTTYTTNTNYVKRQAPLTKSNIPKLSPNISIIPANIHLPKDIQVTVVKKQTTMPVYFNSTKKNFGSKSDQNNSKTVNVKCKVITKSNYDGEVKFYIDLPNGKYHPVSDELMNQYLKEHNNRLPDYWLVPLSVEVAKEYGFV